MGFVIKLPCNHILGPIYRIISQLIIFYYYYPLLLFLAIIPGPKEPSTDQMNFVLRPLIDELLVLQDGLEICGQKVRVKALCWACDLPAIRKTMGFLSFSANMGCSKCLQNCREDGYLTLSTPRTGEEHRAAGARIKVLDATSTKSAKEDYERQTGIR